MMNVTWFQGVPDGCVRIEAMHSIQVYRIPRDYVQELSSEEDLRQKGIYILIDTADRIFYVGQADSRDSGHGLLNRMIEDHPDNEINDKWNIGFTLSNEAPHFFGPTELNYLERFFYDFGISAGKYRYTNKKVPHATEPGSSTRLKLKEYAEVVFILLSQAGCDVFDLTDISHEIKSYRILSAKDKKRKRSNTKTKQNKRQKADSYCSFRDFLQKRMCKKTASNYASSFKVLETILLNANIISSTLSANTSSDDMAAVRSFVSSDIKFREHNKAYHHSLSAAWRKFEEFKQNIEKS